MWVSDSIVSILSRRVADKGVGRRPRCHARASATVWLDSPADRTSWPSARFLTPTASSKTRAPSSRCPMAAAIVSPAFQPLPCHLRALHAHARTAGRVLITLYVTLRRVSTRAASQHVLRPHSPIVSSSALSIAGARIDVHDACDGSLMVREPYGLGLHLPQPGSA